MTRAETLREAQKRARDLRRNLVLLTSRVVWAIRALDAEMKGPSTVERGRHVAAIMNALELDNDSARHFGLGEAFPLRRKP